MSAFIICAVLKSQTPNKVYRPIQVNVGGFWEISEFLNTGDFEAIILIIEVTLLSDYHYAPNIISLTSKVTWGQRLQCKIHVYWSKIRPMTKWHLSSLKCQNVISIWNFNDNKQIWDFRDHIDHKQPRNLKFKFGWARPISTESCLDESVDFNSHHSILIFKIPESWQNFRSIAVLHVYVVITQVEII